MEDFDSKINKADRYNTFIKWMVMAVDIAICVFLFLLVCLLDGVSGRMAVTKTMIVIATIYWSCNVRGGIILHTQDVKRYEIVLRVFKNILLFTVVSMPLLYWGEFNMPGWKYYSLFLLMLMVAITMSRLFILDMVKKFRQKSGNVRRAVLVGTTENNIALYRELTGNPSLGYRLTGYFDDEPNGNIDSKCPWLGKPSEAVAYFAANNNVNDVFCCLPSRRKDEIMPIIHHCENNLMHFYSVPNVRNYLHNRMYFNVIGTVPYLSLHQEPLARPENIVMKRAFDVLFSLTFLVTLFPIIFIIVAIITKLTMPGPIFFVQKRNGLNNKEFGCIKFRSMKVNSQADILQATKDDPRKTKWGDIMRKTNIDELPQFINVLMGNMSVVGPRPHMVKHTEEYRQLIDKYMMRQSVKPGITGWSQVTGFRGETRYLGQMEGRIRNDIWYIEHWSMGLDLFIIYKTVANAIHGEDNAY